MMFEMQFGKSINKFVEEINSLEAFQRVQAVLDELFFSTIKTKISSPIAVIGNHGYNIAICLTLNFEKPDETKEDK